LKKLYSILGKRLKRRLRGNKIPSWPTYSVNSGVLGGKIHNGLVELTSGGILDSVTKTCYANAEQGNYVHVVETKDSKPCLTSFFV
jgi:hypothetical protein